MQHIECCDLIRTQSAFVNQNHTLVIERENEMKLAA